MFCARCGAPNPEGPEVRFCRACGAAFPATAAPQAQVPPRVADNYSPLQPAPPTDGSNGQALPATTVVPVAPIAPVVQVAPVAPAPGAFQVAISPYGGFWIRLVAWLIDQVILGGTVFVAVLILAFTMGLASALAGPELGAALPTGAIWLVILAVPIPYWLLFPPLLGGTPGKLMLGYHVVDEHGRHLSLKRSLGRMLAQIPSAIVLGLGYIWIGVDSRKQGWHDQIARTFVVHKELVRS